MDGRIRVQAVEIRFHLSSSFRGPVMAPTRRVYEIPDAVFYAA